MSKKFRDLIPGIVFLAAMIFPMGLANAQAVTLQEQLTAQYKLVKMGSDTSGYSVVEEGTLLAIQKGGLLGVPYSDNSVQNNKYENGAVKAPNAMLTKGIGFGMKKFGKEQTTKLFAKGDKVYATKIDVSLDKDQVTMGIVACDKCNKTDPPTYNKTNIIFVFPKGSLATTSAGQVEDTIGTLLSISNDDAQQGDSGQQQGGDQQQQGADQGAQPQAGQQQPPAAQEQPPAEPASIDKGMTTDQVQAAMGKPDKIVNLGTKTIYYYKDMKVIFLSGKVSDVQ
ncbi:MAG TPA: hypothetical protein VK706_04115 [Candidatus Sulfotelmatobacter sp.]|jgi:hypothetical protein|nr:hypothetical protein [Candidatus Sulfotelmatobacter sp.]